MTKNYRKGQNAVVNNAGPTPLPATMKVGSTQIKPIINVSNIQPPPPPQPILIPQSPSTNSVNNSSTIITSTPMAESPQIFIQNSSQQKPDKSVTLTNSRLIFIISIVKSNCNFE